MKAVIWKLFVSLALTVAVGCGESQNGPAKATKEQEAEQNRAQAEVDDGERAMQKAARKK